MLPIALQLYSVREDMEKDVYTTLKRVKSLGYDGVEFAGLFGCEPKQLKKWLGELGLVPICAHVPYLDMIGDPDKVLGDYAEIGCRYVAIPYLTEDYRPGTPLFPSVIENAKMLGEKANKLGMTLLYHNHDFEFVKIDGQFALDLLYASVPAEYLQTEIDVCWVRVAGEEPAGYIRKYIGRSPIVHLKDFYKSGEAARMYELIGIKSEQPEEKSTFEFRPLGQGVQDFPPIVQASIDAGALWFVVEQDKATAGMTAFECAQASIAYLKEMK